MFDFFDELFGECKKNSYRFQVDSGKKIVIEGYKNILIIEDERIVIKLFDGELCVVGKNLKVKQFGSNTINICGQINQINLQGENYEK